MIPFFFILLAVSFLSVVVQHFIPPLSFLHGARVFLLPAIMLYGALALPFGFMLALAAFCGLMWDALTVQVIDVSVGASIKPVVEIALGWSILLYATLGAVMSGFRPLFLRGRWEIHCLMTGLCTALVVLAEFLMLSVRRIALFEGSFVYTPEIGWRIGGAGIVALFLAPLIYWLLSLLSGLVGYEPRVAFARKEDDE